MSDERGYRGYITSRSIHAIAFPQRMQNLAIRQYAADLGVPFKLSATEYSMPHCYMMLVAVLEELPSLGGIIAFSCFMLPIRKDRRLAIYDAVLAAGAELHAALEGLALRSLADIARWEDLLDVCAALPATPFGGEWSRGGEQLDPALVLALAAESGSVTRRAAGSSKAHVMRPRVLS